ncbi:unnamed protein product [Sympodiomycopsis kandeliae]
MPNNEPGFAKQDINAYVAEQTNASLPLELLPLILQQLSTTNRLSTLATCSQVCRTWSTFAKPHLWRRLWFRSQDRVRLVFSVLAQRPELCTLVKVIELRVFPLGLPAEQLERLEADIGKALNYMDNLEELVWTRTGSLNDRILPDLISNRQKLHTLELTGNTRYYDVGMLYQGHQGIRSQSPSKATGYVGEYPLVALRNLSFVLPDSNAIQAMTELAKRSQLKSVNILCQHSSVFLPVHAELLSEHLASLDRLILVGCKRLDGDSVRKMLAGSQVGIKTLGLEGVGVHPSRLPTLIPLLSSTLRTLSLTLPKPSFCPHSEFYTHLSGVVSSLENLQEFTLYAPGGVRADEDQDDILDQDGGGVDNSDGLPYLQSQNQEQPTNTSHLVPKMPLSFLRSLLTSKQSGLPHRRLTMLRVHGIICSSEGLRMIGTDASGEVTESNGYTGGLQDLVLQLENGPVLSVITSLLPLSPSLQKLHILSRAGSNLFLPEDDVLWLARSLINYRCPSTYGPLLYSHPSMSTPTRTMPRASLMQIGFRNRVWEVDRRLDSTSVSETTVSPAEVSVALSRWDASEGRWPEAMLVVKA